MANMVYVCAAVSSKLQMNWAPEIKSVRSGDSSFLAVLILAFMAENFFIEV